jgi:hypothetical protein
VKSSSSEATTDTGKPNHETLERYKPNSLDTLLLSREGIPVAEDNQTVSNKIVNISDDETFNSNQPSPEDENYFICDEDLCLLSYFGPCVKCNRCFCKEHLSNHLCIYFSTKN